MRLEMGKEQKTPKMQLKNPSMITLCLQISDAIPFLFLHRSQNVLKVHPLMVYAEI